MLFRLLWSSGVILLVVLSFYLAPYNDAQARDEGMTAEAPLDQYTGSGSCRECHEDQYKAWSENLMASFVSYREDFGGALPRNWRNVPFSKDDIFLIVGWKRKFTFVDESWKVLPYEYLIDKRKWKRRGGWAKNKYDYRRRCAPCHTLASDPVALKFKELNVGCETCHGPGKKHANEPEAKTLIRVPGRNDGRDVLDTCRRCHNDRKNHARAIRGFSGRFH